MYTKLQKELFNNRIDSIIDFILGIGRKYKFIKPKLASLLEDIMYNWRANIVNDAFYNYLRLILQNIILIPAGAGIKDFSDIQVKYKYCPNGAPIKQDDLEPSIRWEIETYTEKAFTKEILPNLIASAKITSKMK